MILYGYLFLFLLIGIVCVLFAAEYFSKRYKVHTKGLVFITGASTGIGLSTALHLDEQGFTILAGVRKQEDADRLKEKRETLLPILIDVSKKDDIKNALKEVKEVSESTGLPLVGLVNNAGVGFILPAEFASLEDIRNCFEVNFFGLLGLTQTLLPELRKSEGRVINIGSMLGEVATPFNAVYSSTKFAVRALTDSLRRELSPFGVYVGVIEPGYIATEIGKKTVAFTLEKFRELPEEAKEYYGEYFREDRIVRSQKLVDNGEKPIKIAQTIYSALVSEKPKGRYLVGNESGIVTLLSFVPDPLVDLMAARTMWPRKLFVGKNAQEKKND